MAPPSRLSIATSSLARLLKEEASYHRELEQQAARIERLENAEEGDQNSEYELRQEKQALGETKAVFPSLHKRISDAVAQLETVLSSDDRSSTSSPTEEISKAKDVLDQAKTQMMGL